MRDPVRDNTFHWNVDGSADFADATSWINTNSAQVPTTGPDSTWTVVVTGGTVDGTAQIDTLATVGFVTVKGSTTNTMTLDIQETGAMMTAAAGASGRVIVSSGGTINVDGQLSTTTLEVFADGIVAGGGTIDALLRNSSGVVNPGSALGAGPGDRLGRLIVAGDYVQSEDAILRIELGDTDSDQLVVTGEAAVAGAIQLALVDGYVPTSGDFFVVLQSSQLIDDSFSLTGDATGFNVARINQSIYLSFQGANPDFDADGTVNCADVDALVAEITGAANDLSFDVNGDGSISPDDLTTWLAAAGALNLESGNPYLLGDVNLDGFVDGQDFIVWNDNKFTASAAWCSGDLNADGTVDGQDFIGWNANKFMASDAVAIPEPTGVVLIAWGLAALAWRRD